MKNFKFYDITCALTHDLQVCEHCKQCGEYPDVRMEMADYVERLEKALDKICLYLTINKPKKSYDEWKEYLLSEVENEQ